MPTFWLFWHVIRDQELLSRARSEVNARLSDPSSRALDFDIPKLCNQPLLQSCYNETLHLRVAVYIIRKPTYEDVRIRDYVVPRDKMMVVSSHMAHKDKRN